MQINSYRQTLFDYLGNPQKSGDALAQAANQQGQQQVFQDLTALEKSVSSADTQNTLDLVDDLNNSVNPQTLDNMIEFYSKRTEERLASIAQSNAIEDSTELQLDQGRWSLLTPNTLDERQSEGVNAYLNADEELQNQLDRLNRLSKAYEFSLIKQEAANLQEQDVPQEKIVSFLQESRSAIFNQDVIRFSPEQFDIGSRGKAAGLIDKFTESLTQ